MVKFWQFFSAVLACLTLVACEAPPTSPLEEAWKSYHSRFYDNGRIVDTGNDNVSHSEGQGYGMLFALAANDKPRFERLWEWTQSRLQRTDKLFSWRYRPCPAADRSCIDDLNNATDGDILIAWALLKAADKWDAPHYRKHAMVIINALRETVILARHGEVLLLPGEHGFIYPNGDVQVNLSYWVFPALHAFAEVTNDAVWDDVAISGIALIAQSERQWQIVPDWLRVTGRGVSLDEVVSPEFGFNACRIPLHLAWQGIDRSLAKPFLSYWDGGRAPATWNLETGNKASYPMSPGMIAVNAAVTALYQVAKSDQLAMSNALNLQDDMDYFSASLVMLSLLALEEGGR